MVIVMLFILFAYVKVNADDGIFGNHEVSVSYSLFTTHLSGGTQDNGEDYNEDNDIIALSVNRWVGTTFVNSYDKRSYGLGRTFRTGKWSPIDDDFFGRLNLSVGAIYGYGEQLPDVGGWTPGAVPALEVGYKRVSFDTIFIPSGSPVVSSLIKITF
jgi:hypothetical protein